jgi:hypothetical protein
MAATGIRSLSPCAKLSSVRMNSPETPYVGTPAAR